MTDYLMFSLYFIYLLFIYSILGSSVCSSDYCCSWVLVKQHTNTYLKSYALESDMHFYVFAIVYTSSLFKYTHTHTHTHTHTYIYTYIYIYIYLLSVLMISLCLHLLCNFMIRPIKSLWPGPTGRWTQHVCIEDTADEQNFEGGSIRFHPLQKWTKFAKICQNRTENNGRG